MTNTATNPATNPELRALAVATDTRLAELDGEYAALDAQRARRIGSVRSILGHKSRRVSRTEVEWPTTEDEAVAELMVKLNNGEVVAYEQDRARDTLVALDELAAQIAANRLEAGRLDEVWADNGYWSRFYTVKGGHIHYDITGYRCSRTFTTQHGWNPDLSGATEDEAVAKLGPSLCTHCFPSAPVEWTVGPAKPARCAGSNKAPAAGTRWTRGMKTYGDCVECGTRQIVTFSGIRAHKPQA